MLVIKLLGQFSVLLNDQPIEIPSRPAQSLFAYLTLQPGTAFRRERLAGLIWPEANESNARSNLRHALWRIRKAIGEQEGQDYFLADDLTLAFRPDPGCWIDAVLLSGKAGPAAPTLEEQVAAYQGELLPGFYEDWITIERERLQAAFESKIGTLIDRLSREQHWPDAIEWAEHWIKFGTAPEPAYRALMTAHARSGHKAKAKEAYQRCVDALQREFGVEPSEETQTLYQQLIATRPLVKPITAEPAATPRHNLPVQATPLIGREAELAEIADRLVNDPDCRLLTLVGPGGIGKTRLALQAAAQSLPHFDDGTFFISCEAITTAEAIVPAIVRTLLAAIQDQKDPRAQLIDYLHDKNLLLVLDNLEHLLEGATLIAEMLSAAPAIKIIVTSRERLHLQWEWLYEVQGLDCPRETTEDVERYGAVQLFLQTARRMRARFSLVEEQPHVIRICLLVEGLPLGLELAASWVRVMSCQEIAQQIEHNLDVLSAQLKDTPDRHRSARAVFEYSWSLLAPEERITFMKLAVFPGGFRREAAEKVAGAPLSLLFTLTDKSLLRVSAAGRYDMHSLLRQYVSEKLAQSNEGANIQTRLIHHYLDYARQHQRDYVALEEEHINLMACLEMAHRNRQAQLVLDYAEALGEMWSVRGHWSEARQGYAWACDAARTHADNQALANYLRRWGEACIEQGDYPEAQQQLQASWQLGVLANDRRGMADAQYDLARVALETSQHAEADNLLSKCLDIRKQIGDQAGISQVLYRQAWLNYDFRRIATAEDQARQALALQEQVNDEHGRLLTLHLLADICLQGKADYASAERYCTEAIHLCDQLQATGELASALNTLAETYRLQGNPQAARQVAERSLKLSRQMGSRKSQAHHLFRLSKIDADLGGIALAVQEASQSLELCRVLQDRWGMVYVLEHLGRLYYDLKNGAQGQAAWQEALSLAAEMNHPLADSLRQRLMPSAS